MIINKGNENILKLNKEVKVNLIPKNHNMNNKYIECLNTEKCKVINGHIKIKNTPILNHSILIVTDNNRFNLKITNDSKYIKIDESIACDGSEMEVDYLSYKMCECIDVDVNEEFDIELEYKGNKMLLDNCKILGDYKIDLK